MRPPPVPPQEPHGTGLGSPSCACLLWRGLCRFPFLPWVWIACLVCVAPSLAEVWPWEGERSDAAALTCCCGAGTGTWQLPQLLSIFPIMQPNTLEWEQRCPSVVEMGIGVVTGNGACL